MWKSPGETFSGLVDRRNCLTSSAKLSNHSPTGFSAAVAELLPALPPFFARCFDPPTTASAVAAGVLPAAAVSFPGALFRSAGGFAADLGSAFWAVVLGAGVCAVLFELRFKPPNANPLLPPAMQVPG